MSKEVNTIMKGTVQRLIRECDGIPRKWGARFPTHRKDFMGEMKVGIMIAVNKYGKDVKPELVRTIVGRRCQEYISQIPAVRIPPTTGRRKKSAGLDTMVSLIEFMDENPTYTHCNEQDVIETICLTLFEYRVLIMRLEGRNQDAIAEACAVSQPTVSRAIRKIRSQFNDTRCLC